LEKRKRRKVMKEGIRNGIHKYWALKGVFVCKKMKEGKKYFF